MTLFPNSNKALPRCEGPKLHPFHDRKAVVTFLRLLSEVDAEGHAHVFEVLIGSKHYALKVVSIRSQLSSAGLLLGLILSTVQVL